MTARLPPARRVAAAGAATLYLLAASTGCAEIQTRTVDGTAVPIAGHPAFQRVEHRVSGFAVTVAAEGERATITSRATRECRDVVTRMGDVPRTTERDW